MTFVLVCCVAGIFAIEMLGKSICETRLRRVEVTNGVQMACEIDGHTYVVNAPTYSRACQCWTAYAADPDLNFTWSDAAYMNRLTRAFFATREAVK